MSKATIKAHISINEPLSLPCPAGPPLGKNSQSGLPQAGEAGALLPAGGQRLWRAAPAAEGGVSWPLGSLLATSG